MGKTKIEWATDVWNPLRGCSKVSAGCASCYAEKVAARFSGPGQPYEGLATRGPARWTGEVRLIEKHLEDPLRWRKPRRIFVNSMSDMFHESLSNETIAKVFRVICEANHGPFEERHTYQILTKRAERMVDWFEWAKEHESGWFSPITGKLDLGGVWTGVSVEDQKTADERISLLLRVPVAVRFISAEPLLGPIDLAQATAPRTQGDDANTSIGNRRLAWVIVGGESGHGARPMDPQWASDIVVACQGAGVPVFMKQMGSVWAERHGNRDIALKPGHVGWKIGRLRSPKGAVMKEWPEQLRVQEFPA